MKTYTNRQEKQLQFLEKMESMEYLGDGRKYFCECKECKVKEILTSAGTVSALFMSEHQGHNTWINLIK